MTNIIDITNLSDAALEVVLRSKTEPNVPCEHLSAEERRQVAVALGWKMTPYVLNWISTPRPNDHSAFADNNDYEGAILSRQESVDNF